MTKFNRIRNQITHDGFYHLDVDDNIDKLDF